MQKQPLTPLGQPVQHDVVDAVFNNRVNRRYRRMVVAGYPACDGTYLAALSDG